jgi:hypothetical protein
MADDGRLELEFVDVYGARIAEPVDATLKHQSLSEQLRLSDLDATKMIAVRDLRRQPQGLYLLEAEAHSYHRIQRFVTVPSSGTAKETVILPIRADRARAVFPKYDELDDRVKGILERSNAVSGHEGLSGRELYGKLDDTAKAGLLNIAKKSLATSFRNGADLLPHLTILRIVGDRCLVEVPGSLAEQVPTLGDIFRSVNGSLHNPPTATFVPAGSFKTLDAFGNLQLTFFKSGEKYCADVDIDDAAGLAHVLQVARNSLSGQPTHPYNINQILMKHQNLDPGYRLVPKA